MADEMKVKKAKQLYASLCEQLDEMKLIYDKHEKDLVITFGLRGEDIPMQFVLNIDAERQLIRLLSLLPVKFEEDKRVDACIATCEANCRIVDGSFDFDYEDGSIIFRMTSSFLDSLISKDLFAYMIVIGSRIVDEYNDKFLMLSKGMIPLEDFFKDG